jgi:ABC-type transporter MlaC component
MPLSNRIYFLIIAIALMLFAQAGAAAQPSAEDSKAIANAKRLFQLIRDDKHEDVAKEFNEKMAAAMPVEKMRGAWASVLQQTGAFKSIDDEQVQRPAEGYVAAILGCQFENAAVNATFVFDAAGKLAGVSFRPRQ